MFFSNGGNNRINEIHEGVLRFVYNGYKTSFSAFLAVGGLFTAHHTNIQTILLEMYKIKHNLPERCLKVLFSVVNGNSDLLSQSGINAAFYEAISILHILYQ